VKPYYFLLLLFSHISPFLSQGTWKTVSVGPGFSVALHSDGTLWSWGVNNYAQLGNDTAAFNGGAGIAYNNVPVQVVTPFHDWIAVDCAEAYTVAIRANGTLWGWGCKKNVNSASPVLVYSPEQIGIDSNFVSVSAGYNFYAAIKADGTLWTWGANNHGQLGRVDSTEWVETPIQVGLSANWKQISCGTGHSVALDSAGHMYFWGQRSWGPNSGTIQYTPVMCDSYLYQYVCAGNGTSAAIQANGSLWVWGFNYGGYLGFGDVMDRSVPTQLGIDFDWSKIYTGSSYFLGLKNDKTLWGWGYNGDGQFGNGSFDNITAPSPISLNGATYDQVAVVSGPCFFEGPSLPFGYHTLCVTANQLSICAAGLNLWGYLGTGNFTDTPEFNCSVFNLASIDEKPKLANLIYPNPSNGKFTLEAPLEAGQQVQIFNVNGQRVFSQPILISGLNISLEPNLPQGLYLLKLINEEGSQIGSSRVVVE